MTSRDQVVPPWKTARKQEKHHSEDTALRTNQPPQKIIEQQINLEVVPLSVMNWQPKTLKPKTIVEISEPTTPQMGNTPNGKAAIGLDSLKKIPSPRPYAKGTLDNHNMPLSELHINKSVHDLTKQQQADQVDSPKWQKFVYPDDDDF